MDFEQGDARGKKSIVVKGILFALVASVAFGAGVSVGSESSTAAVVQHLPFIGDGLDATIDPNADLTAFWKAWNALNQNYVITHASSSLPTTKEKLYGVIKGLADSYGDPYTTFFPPEEAKSFAESIAGVFGGVGLEIDVKDNVLTVVSPLKGTPADAAGIKAGDLIAAINGKTTEGLSVEEAVKKIRGEVGTTVEFTLIRSGKPLTVKVTRQVIQVPETKEEVIPGGIYYIALYEFSANAAQLFDKAFEQFKASGSKKLIIDLRGNPGGYLDAAVDIASHFMPKGSPVVTEDYGGKKENDVHTSHGYLDVPAGSKVVVLVDGGSASASEILAGALQDTGAATIIGSKSFGKGSVQTLINLDGGSLKVTVARWVTPAGHWIMGNGITPDIKVGFTQEDVTAKKDPQKDRAIEFLNTNK